MTVNVNVVLLHLTLRTRSNDIRPTDSDISLLMMWSGRGTHIQVVARRAVQEINVPIMYDFDHLCCSGLSSWLFAFVCFLILGE